MSKVYHKDYYNRTTHEAKLFFASTLYTPQFILSFPTREWSVKPIFNFENLVTFVILLTSYEDRHCNRFKLNEYALGLSNISK